MAAVVRDDLDALHETLTRCCTTRSWRVFVVRVAAAVGSTPRVVVVQ
jgi:hypothetical protein